MAQCLPPNDPEAGSLLGLPNVPAPPPPPICIPTPTPSLLPCVGLVPGPAPPTNPVEPGEVEALTALAEPELLFGGEA